MGLFIGWRTTVAHMDAGHCCQAGIESSQVTVSRDMDATVGLSSHLKKEVVRLNAR